MNRARSQATRSFDAAIARPAAGRRSSLQQGRHAAVDCRVAEAHEAGAGEHAEGAFWPATFNDERHGGCGEDDDGRVALNAPERRIGLTRRERHRTPRASPLASSSNSRSSGPSPAFGMLTG